MHCSIACFARLICRRSCPRAFANTVSKDDPLAGMGLTESGYSELTGIVAGIAKKYAQGRILSSLEGGYNLTALAASVDAHVRGLLAA